MSLLFAYYLAGNDGWAVRYDDESLVLSMIGGKVSVGGDWYLELCVGCNRQVARLNIIRSGCDSSLTRKTVLIVTKSISSNENWSDHTFSICNAATTLNNLEGKNEKFQENRKTKKISVPEKTKNSIIEREILNILKHKSI